MIAGLLVALPLSLLVFVVWAWHDVRQARREEMIRRALDPRPAWRVRLLVEGHSLPALACFRVPEGYARTPREAIEAVLRRHASTVRRLPPGRWLAFPVVRESGAGAGAERVQQRA